MRSYQLGLLPGDGIGPEIIKATLAILEAAAQKSGQVRFKWRHLPIGWAAIRSAGQPLPPETVQKLTTCQGWLLGPHDSVSYPEQFKQTLNPSGQLRLKFDLYANIRPAKTIPGLPSLAKNTDLVIVRENTEGFYPDRNMHQGVGEVMPTPELALVTGVFSKRASERIAQVAFQLAQSRRRRVTIAHKANVIRLGHGLFRDTCRAVGQSYPEVKVDELHIDALMAHLVRRPEKFDVIVTTNMIGDIVSDLTAELVGSLGLGGSLNAGDDYAMAQAVHGAAPDIAERGIANPVGMMRSAVMLLAWLSTKYGHQPLAAVAQMIDQAIDDTLSTGPRTPDLGGSAGTAAFTQAVRDRIQA